MKCTVRLIDDSTFEFEHVSSIRHYVTACAIHSARGVEGLFVMSDVAEIKVSGDNQ